jgi:catalase-peroxidase
MDKRDNSGKSKCPFMHEPQAQKPSKTLREWWPNRLPLDLLRQGGVQSNPMGAHEDYPSAFKKLEFTALKNDLRALMTESQAWWPADFGHYGGLFIRMAWHSAGTYRVSDGRGGAGSGQQRFAPLNSWPDNANLDKARRLLWPIKQKYGNSISWADLMILTGNVALESMGFKTIGFAAGRVDAWEPDQSVYWGSEGAWLDDKRYTGDRELESPLAAVQMGLIYVNPEGPNGHPDPLAAAKDIRETFKRMAMNDEETVALIAGGHSFGKTHGAGDPALVGPAPEDAPLEQMGLGWLSYFKTGKGDDAITGGPEVIWTRTPTQWSHDFFHHLFEYEWELEKSPAGAYQFRAKNSKETIPDPFDSTVHRVPTMLVTDLALRMDPSYEKISRRYYEHPKEFEAAFARAWFKLTHRDMGPRSRYLGPEIPQEIFLWQDPLPQAAQPSMNSHELKELKAAIEASGISISDLVETAWASASTYRKSDKRGGANGARIRLAPQNQWEVNQPLKLKKNLDLLSAIQEKFKSISMADLIVLGGCFAIEQAANNAGYQISVPFNFGRTDAAQVQTDIESFNYLEPKADAFRNFYSSESHLSPENALIDKALLLGLSVPEMTVLIGGLRSLGVSTQEPGLGILIDKKDRLTAQYFVNLLSNDTEWKPIENTRNFRGIDRHTQRDKWVASPVDLVFGSNSELRAVSEFYAQKDNQEKFIHDCVSAWTKVMNAYLG